MKHLFTSVFFAALMQTASAQITIPNAGFESWAAGTFFIAQEPVGWHSSDVFPGVAQATDAHSGAYAMKLSVAPYGTGVGGDNMGFAFSTPEATAVPMYFTFWAKIHISGTDKFNTHAVLTHTGTTLVVADIANSVHQLNSTDNTTTWRQVSYPLQSTNSGAYDSVTLGFSFYPQLDTASHVTVDDLAFGDHPAGIADVSALSIIEQVYPNPARGLATVIYTLSEQADVAMDVYDLQGRHMGAVISERQISGRYKAEIDTERYPDGIYLIHLTTGGESHIQKLVIQH